MRFLDSARTRLRLLFSRRTAETRMNSEFQFHIDMHTELLIREQGLSRDEARRRALVAFGGIEKHKELLRDDRGLAWMSGLSLDLKLGVRTLSRSRGVTIVGGLAIAIGVGLGAGYMEVVNDFLHPTLPLEEGERIVGLQNWDVAENDPELRSLHDYVVWRDALKSIENLAAFRTIERNVAGGDSAEPALGAEITASAFRTTRVPPMLGRTLIEADEQETAAPLVVLGYQLWRSRFAEDPNVVGKSVQLGTSTRTVVGVMPEDFEFPVNHQFWVPLHADAMRHEPRQGPAIQIFGRLAPGATLEQAQAELSALGAVATTDYPSTHEHLRPRVMKYTQLFVGGEGSGGAYLVQVLFVLLLLVLCSNVATMVFARTATREHEIAMRFALGSSRARIVGQFFVEALVLAVAATATGLAAVWWGAHWVTRFVWDVTEGQIPFWLDAGVALNLTTILYAAALAVLGSLVAGAVPALKATRARVLGRLRHNAGAGESALRFGTLWSAMIVVQAAFVVLILPPAVVAVSGLFEPAHTDPGFAAEEYLSARIALDAEQVSANAASLAPPSLGEFERACEELRRRLTMTSRISLVTFASRLPGMSHPEAWVDVDSEGTTAGASTELVTTSSVAANYFEAFGAEIVSGRAFNSGDVRSNPSVVIVNEYFVNEILQGRNAVGRRLRYTRSSGEAASGPWYEIVGVVKNLGMDTTRDAFMSGKGPGIYHPLTPEVLGTAGSYAVRIAFHVGRDAASFAPELRALAHAVHPALRLDDVVPLNEPVDRTARSQRRIGRFSAWATVLVALIALLISIAGTYSALSFTVARQTREIGIRIALGADRRQIVMGVFSRALAQVCTGIVIGGAVWFYVIVEVLDGGHRVGLLATTLVVLMLVGLLACGLPLRRALRIEPTEALRHSG
jgi:predicted permease